MGLLAGRPCENSDEDIGLSRRRPVGRWIATVGGSSHSPQTMAHLLSRRLLDEACTADDLATVTERAKACARRWEKNCVKEEEGGIVMWHFCSRAFCSPPFQSDVDYIMYTITVNPVMMGGSESGLDSMFLN